MTIHRALILYKKSAYSIYFQHAKSSFHQRGRVNAAELKRFRNMHKTHLQCVDLVEKVIKSLGIKVSKISRGKSFCMDDFDLVVTVGGDGTFLEAAQKVSTQLILGVNSDPSWSVGRFCTATSQNFLNILERLMDQKAEILSYPRLSLNLSGIQVDFLNEVLVCHRNPAAMSRYALQVGKIIEEQKSSGVWISTAAGSTGAIRSAGGRRFPPTKNIIQYRPRELYAKKDHPYLLKGGVIINGEKVLKVISMMREGRAFVDGSHLSFPLDFGNVASIKNSSFPLKVVVA